MPRFIPYCDPDRIFPTTPGRIPADPPSLGFLLAFAYRMLHNALTGFPEQSRQYLPNPLRRRAQRNAPQTLATMGRALGWLIALHKTLAGSLEFLRPLRPRAAPAAAPQTAPAPTPAKPRPPGVYDPETANLARLSRALQTQPIGRIVRRICRGLGIDPNHDFWPEFALQLTETPVACAARHFGPRTPPKRFTVQYWRKRLTQQAAQQASQAAQQASQPIPPLRE
ncbi:MAG: hypothetical protein POG24_11765 [Acidocella sp.]|nr:hypothetical protein [Acidocella sp.]